MTRKNSFVPAPIVVISLLSFGLGVCIGFVLFVKSDRKDALRPAGLRQQEASQDGRSAATAEEGAAQAQAPSVQHDGGVGKPIDTPASGKRAVHYRSKALPGMVWIPGGKYLMGSPEGVGNANEHPRHAVIVNGFYMDTTEVTQERYARVMGVNPSHFKECPACPVENVSWDDAMTYCQKVGKRLPTEAQWEYACRAGTTTVNYWGDDSNDRYAWFRENSEQKTHPVGRKKPNRLGLYDMMGNVWEWCGDWFDSTYYGKGPLYNPQGPPSGMHRVFRGGSWLSNVATLHSALRDWGVPDSRDDLFGFRCVYVP